MKFIAAALYLSIASVVLADPDDASLGINDDSEHQAHRELDACIISHSISLDEGKCNFDLISKAIMKNIDDDPRCKIGTSPEDEFRGLFMDQTMTNAQVEAAVNLACEDAFYEMMYGKDRLSFIDVLDDSQQMVKEYFDGRGAVNSKKEWDRALGLSASMLTKTPLQWPGDSVFEYKSAMPSGINSLFPRNHFANRKNGVPNKTSGMKTIGPDRNNRSAQRIYSPIQNFNQCQLNTAMCCWTESTDETKVFGDKKASKKGEPLDHNTDICYVNMADAPSSSRVRAGFAIFPGLAEVAEGQGSVRCHGFNWAEDPMDVTSLFKGNALFQSSFQQHLERGGYVSSISGSPMCGCLEQMPVVTRADCTQTNVEDFGIVVDISRGNFDVKISESTKVSFSPCVDPAKGSKQRRLEELDPAAEDPVVEDAAPVPDTNTTEVAAPVEEAEKPEDPKANVVGLREYYELMVEKKMIPDKRSVVAKRLVGEGGCTEVVANFFNDNGIHARI